MKGKEEKACWSLTLLRRSGQLCSPCISWWLQQWLGASRRCPGPWREAQEQGAGLILEELLSSAAFHKGGVTFFTLEG